MAITKIHLAVDASGMPVRLRITDGTAADYPQAHHLIDVITAAHLLADKACDTDALLNYCRMQSINPVIPSKSNRKDKRTYEHNLYKSRHLIENAFLYLKRWRGIATRYAKNATSFLAAAQIRCLALWLNNS